MPDIWIARRPQRQALMLPLGGTKQNPNTIIPLYRTERSELDELVRALLEKQGRTGEVDKIIEQAELDYENRVKVDEARKELRRLMAIRASGGKLMQQGFRKWKQAFYRPIGGK